MVTFRKYLPNGWDLQNHNLSVILQSTTSEMVTSWENNISLHFQSRLKKIIKFRLLDNPQFRQLGYKEKKVQVDKLFHHIIDEGQESPWGGLPLQIKKEVFGEDFLLPTLKMATILEGWEATHPGIRPKLFQALPIRTSLIPHHITLHTNGLINLMDYKGFKFRGKEYKVEKLIQSFKGRRTLRTAIWDKYFKMSKDAFRQKGYNFLSLKTDGISASLLFIKEGLDLKEIPEPTEFRLPTVASLSQEICGEYLGRTIIGLDPGTFNLVQLADSEKRFRYRAPQRQHETKRRHFKGIRDSLAKAVKPKEEKLSQHNKKVVNLEQFLAYVWTKLGVSIEVGDHYENPTYRKLNLRAHVLGEQSEQWCS